MPSVSVPAAIASIGASISSAAASVGIGTAAAGAAGAAGAAAFPIGAIGAGSAAAALTGGIETASIAAVPAWLSTVGEVGLGLNAAGGLIGAVGAIKSANAAASSAKYNAQVEARNAEQASKNADLASASGSAAAGDQGLKNKAAIGSIEANTAASGLDVNSGSPVSVESSATDLGNLDALRIRSNATREAYGYQVDSESHKAQAGLDRSEASSDLTSGYVNAGATLLSSAGTAATNFAKYQLSGGFSA